MYMQQGGTKTFEVPEIDQHDVVVLHDYNGFPFYGQEFISTNLVISIVTKGQSYGYYDKREVLFLKNQISIILPNHICMEQNTTADYEVELVIISPEFLDEIVRTTGHRNFLQYHYEPILQLSQEMCDVILRLINSLRDVCSLHAFPHRHDMLLNMVDVLFTMISGSRIGQEMHEHGTARANEVYNQFCNLLTKHYKESREVSFYAEKLRLSPKHFSKVIQQITGQTASYWIEQHISVQAQQMLRTRKDMTISEICYFLGFEDLAHFSRYFKNVTGMNPRQYRKQADGGRSE